MNLGAMAKIGAFLSSHPGVIELLNNFPKLRPETGKKLLEFLERALREQDPEAYIVEALKLAMDLPRNVKSTVIEVKRNP